MTAADKEPYPGVWVCGVGGTCKSGETFEEAAHRELEEELGIKAELEVMTTWHYDADMEATFRLYTTKGPLSIGSLKLDPSEVERVEEFKRAALVDP